MFKSNNHIRFVASALVLAFALSQPFVLIANANIAAGELAEAVFAQAFERSAQVGRHRAKKDVAR